MFSVSSVYGLTFLRMTRRTLFERVNLVKMFYACDKTAEETARLYNSQHESGTPVDGKTLRSIIKRFEETGSVEDRKRSGRLPTKTDDVAAYNIITAVKRSPKKSVRRIAQECSTSKSSVHWLLKSRKFKSYVDSHLQILRCDDMDKRYEFASWFLTHCEIHDTFFTDEAIFHLNGRFRKTRYWAVENPRRYIPCREQYSPKVMVWAGILGTKIIGPYFFENNVTGKLIDFFIIAFKGVSYCKMLTDFVEPFLQSLPITERSKVWYQQDGAPPHYSKLARDCITEIFGSQWISRGGPVNWPPRSPDLTSLDFFLWPHLKRTVYNNRPRTLTQLKENITNAISAIPEEMLLNVEAAAWRRLLLCKQNNGQHFEHLLK